MSIDQKLFVAQRGRKVFQCNMSSGPSPQEMLGVAANGLSLITDKFTGQKIWNISKQPLPLAEDPRGMYIFASAKYPVANFGGTVGLTLGAIPEGPPGTRFMAVLEDSNAWDIPSAEDAADMALCLVEKYLNSRFRNGGWRMLQGAWRYPHKFSAPSGVPPSPPAPPPPEIPEDFFTSPVTSRGFGAVVVGIDPASLVKLAGGSLTSSWNLEFDTETIDGARVPIFGGVNSAWPSLSLQISGIAIPQQGRLALTVVFADQSGWSTVEANDALSFSVGRINAALQTRFPRLALSRIAAPG